MPRQTLGMPPHRETTAKPMGVVLGSVQRGHRSIDGLTRVATQSASKLVHVDGVDQLAHPNVTAEVGSDTIGFTFPGSAARSKYAQTWAVTPAKDEPPTGFYVAANHSHTSAASVVGLK